MIGRQNPLKVISFQKPTSGLRVHRDKIEIEGVGKTAEKERTHISCPSIGLPTIAH